MKKNFVKTAIVTSALGLTLSVAAPTALAVKTDQAESKVASQVDDTFFSVNPPVDELLTLGLSAAEISALMNVKSTGITLKNGVAYDKNGLQLDATERGKLTWVVKALKAAYKKLPGWAKNALGGTGGLALVLKVVDTYTGKVEDALYKGCRTLGMGKIMARIVTKTLLFFL